MKKNRMMRLAAFLLVCVLLTTSVISGTYAKYTSTATASDTAKVAKWDIVLNGKSITESFTFDLFKTIVDTVDGNTDAQVAAGKIIAPGTKGSFTIELQNKSEVTAEYVIDYTVTNTANIPVEFSVDGNTWGALADVATPVTLQMGATTATTIPVQWRWVFTTGTEGDAVDTALGLAGSAELKVEAKITVNQVD